MMISILRNTAERMADLTRCPAQSAGNPSSKSSSRNPAGCRIAETGVPVPELCREHGMSSASFYKWRAKYGGMDASLMAEMKTVAARNSG